jgi:hypothetical protein
MMWVAVAALACALLPCLLFLCNMLFFAEPPPPDGHEGRKRVSVLIPARNEELSIGAAVEGVLRSTGVDLELIVLDDASTDGTAEVVRGYARKDARVRLATAPALPEGWNGKQYACHVLSSLARYELLCFLDADVRLAPRALARMAAFQRASGADLVSGFPRQETKTFLERLLLPLIHFVLLGFLPLAMMRRYAASPGFAAGCGQFMMTDRHAYQRSGGHAAIRTTMHDGLLLPRRYRSAGLRTDLADMTHLATCRMYRSAAEVWRGLSKNATEGLAAPSRIGPFTLLLGLGQVLPLPLLLWMLWKAGRHAGQMHRLPEACVVVAAAATAGYLPRLAASWRYRQSWRSALLHPLGIAVLLLLQWVSLIRKLCGVQATWKQRAYDAG